MCDAHTAEAHTAVSRRTVLQAGAAAALGAVVLGRPGAAGAAPVSAAGLAGTDPLVAAMHVHASYSENEGSWEEQYAKAHARWEAHVKQQAEAAKAEVEAGEATSYSSGNEDTGTSSEGSLASDEALQALREKLTGGGN